MRTKQFFARLMCVIMLLGLVPVSAKTAESVEEPMYTTQGNPYLPLWEWIPDGEPYVFEDPDNPGEYRLYVYGSHDMMKTHYCGWDLVGWSAPVDDLSQWRYEGVIFESIVNGKADVLYAPDVTLVEDQETGEKTYYLYPNNQGWTRNSMVAKSNRPDGPFEVCNWNPEKPTETVGVLGFDPAVFVDDDGRVYGYWGYKTSYAAELDPTTMATVKPGTEIIEHMIDNVERDEAGLDTTSDGHGWRFFEASSIRKVEDTYVFIYARTGRADEPSGETGGTLAYAYSTESPLGPWTYGGTIIDCGGEILDAEAHKHAFPGGNTHGSICEINGQWYVFYHRNPSMFARQGMVEAIDLTVNDDGSIDIKQADVTSKGFNIDGLDPYRKHSAAILSFMTGGGTIVPAYDHELTTLQLTNLRNDTIIGYKYFDFNQEAPEGKTTELEVEMVPLGVDATIDVCLRPITDYGVNPKKIDGVMQLGGESKKIAQINLTADMPQVMTTFRMEVPEVDTVDGQWGLFFVFHGAPSGQNICDMYNLQFLFDDNTYASAFDTAEGWALPGNAVVENGTLQLTDESAAVYEEGGQWTDYAVSANVESYTGAMNIRFRQTDENNYYEVTIEEQQLTLASVLFGTRRILDTATYLAGEEAFTVSIDAVEDVLSVRLNGAMLLSVTDDDHNVGSIAFATQKGGSACVTSVAVSKSVFTPPHEEAIGVVREDSILIDGIPFDGFTTETGSYLIELESDSAIPNVTALSTDPSVAVSVAQAAEVPGSAFVSFLAEDGTLREYCLKFYTKDSRSQSLAGLEALPDGWEYVHTSDAAMALVTFEEEGIMLHGNNAASWEDYPVSPGMGKNFAAIGLTEHLQGDWQIDVSFKADVEMGTDGGDKNYQGYGIGLYTDGNHYAKYVVANRPEGQSTDLSGNGIDAGKNYKITRSEISLRLIKVGNSLSAYVSNDQGQKYTLTKTTTMKEGFIDPQLVLYATKVGGTKTYDALVTSVSILKFGKEMAESADLHDVNNAMSAIGNYILLPTGTYDTAEEMAAAAEQVLAEREDLQFDGIAYSVSAIGDTFALQVCKGDAILKRPSIVLAVQTGDWAALTALIAESQALSEELYTFATWNKLQIALAQALLCSEDSDPLEIIDAYDRLKLAYDNLQKEEQVGDAVISFVGTENAVEGKETTYSVSVENVARMATMTVWFEVDGEYFQTAATAVTGLNGFDLLGSVEWTAGEGTKWIGRATLAYLDGQSLTVTDAVELLQLQLLAREKLGQTEVVLTKVQLSGFNEDGSAVYIESAFKGGVNTVDVTVDKEYSIYDVNCDGQVDQLDITAAQKYFALNEGDEGWNAAADVNGDGKVAIDDLILILNNIVW